MTTPQDEKPAVGNFAELSEADCKELLAQHSAGRTGFMAGDGPQILPVTYQYRNGSVVSVPLRLDLWLGSSVVPVSLLRSTASMRKASLAGVFWCSASPRRWLTTTC